MLKIVMQIFCYFIVAAILIISLFAADARRRRRLVVARLIDLDLGNCAQLLAFLESSFAGATVGELQMDELTASLRRILEACRKP